MKQPLYEKKTLIDKFKTKNISVLYFSEFSSSAPLFLVIVSHSHTLSYVLRVKV